MESNYDEGVILNSREKKHKEKPPQFRSVAGGVQKRLEENLKRGKSSRSSWIDSTRNIPKCDSPAPLSKAQLKIELQRQELEQWKREKENRKKAEAKNKKKPFIVGVVQQPIGFQPLPLCPVRTLTKTNKLKTCVPKSTTVVTETKYPSFAPKNAQFHPPQMINLAKIPVHLFPTRSKAAQVNLHTKLTEKTDTKFTKKMQNQTVPRKTMPKKLPNKPVPKSGKDLARKEMMMKSKEGLLDEDASDMKSVQYFRQQLHSEIQRMTELCDSWDKTATQNVLPETAQELLLGAVGQARLLMSAKLQQFRSLLERCEQPELDVARVTLADLHGFWDMVYLQIENINARFLKLEELRKRGWAEELPGSNAEAPSCTPGKVPRVGRRAKVAAVTQPSRLRELIVAARRAKKAAAREAEGKYSEASNSSERSPVQLQTGTAQQRSPFALLRASLAYRDVEGVEPLPPTPPTANTDDTGAPCVHGV